MERIGVCLRSTSTLTSVARRSRWTLKSLSKAFSRILGPEHSLATAEHASRSAEARRHKLIAVRISVEARRPSTIISANLKLVKLASQQMSESWRCTYTNAQRFCDNCSQRTLPLNIPKRDYLRQHDVSMVIVGFFLAHYR